MQNEVEENNAKYLLKYKFEHGQENLYYLGKTSSYLLLSHWKTSQDGLIATIYVSELSRS